MGEILLSLIQKHGKTVAEGVMVITIGAYIAFLHHTIANDHVMLDTAHDQMIKMSAEYRADVEAMSKAIKTQNEQITVLTEETKVSKETLATAEKAANTVRTSTQAQVNAILAKPTPVGCDNSIGSAIVGIKDLQWGPKK